MKVSCGNGGVPAVARLRPIPRSSGDLRTGFAWLHAHAHPPPTYSNLVLEVPYHGTMVKPLVTKMDQHDLVPPNPSWIKMAQL